MNIQDYLNQIKNAIFGKDVRQAIHDAIKQCYDDASVDHDNANMEVKLARGTHETLNDRITENEKNQEKLSSDLDTIENKKLNKTDTLSMANMGQDVKEAITGGSVAVVGRYSVDDINVKYSSMDIYKTKFIKSGNNLLSSNELIDGYLKGNGEINNSDIYKTTKIIPTSGEKYITLARNSSGNGVLYGARDIRFAEFYNANVEPIIESFYDNSNMTSESVAIPSEASYIRVSIKTGYDDGNSMLYFGESGDYSYFEEHKKIIDDLSFSDATNKEIQNNIRKFILENNFINLDCLNFAEKIGNNLWNNELYTVGYIQNNGNIYNDSNYLTSGYKLIQGDVISPYIFESDSPTLSYIRKLCYFDENLKPLPNIFYDNTTKAPEKVTLNKKAVYYRYSISKSFNNNMMVVYGETPPEQLQPVKYKLKNILNDTTINNTLEGKILFNFGDSIAAGDGNNGKGYAEILGEMYGMTVYDFAKGGATLGDTESNNITAQVDDAIAKGIKPHYILMEGGTNDIANYNVPIGEIASDYNLLNFDKTTTSGGLEYCLYKLKNAFPDAKIVFVSVHKMGSRDYTKQVERQQRCKDICEKWCIPVADIGKRGNLNTFLICMHKYTNPTESQPNGDRTHPNDLGYRIYYIPIIYSVLIAI